MTVTHTVDWAAAAKRTVMSGLILVAWGVATGLLVGLILVQILDWLGVHVDTGGLLHRAFLP